MTKEDVINAIGLIFLNLIFILMLGLTWYILISNIFYNVLELYRVVIGWIFTPILTVCLIIYEIIEWIPEIKSCFRKEEKDGKR